MKTAKEMFEELGYELIVDDVEITVYKRVLASAKTFTQITFNKIYNSLEVYVGRETIIFIMSEQELKAINKQIVELGW